MVTNGAHHALAVFELLQGLASDGVEINFIMKSGVLVTRNCEIWIWIWMHVVNHIWLINVHIHSKSI